MAKTFTNPYSLGNYIYDITDDICDNHVKCSGCPFKNEVGKCTLVIINEILISKGEF